MRAVQRVRGMRDEDPTALARRMGVSHAVLATLERWGYAQAASPTIEQQELFLRSLGTESDAVKKELYIVDGETALRPEGTAGLVRMFLEGRHESNVPVRWSYDADMFRRERPQKGRWRQFRQVGAELFSGTSFEECVAADVELMAVGWQVVTDVLGSSEGLTLKVNTLGDAESRQRYQLVLEEFLQSRRADLSEEGRARLDRGAILRVLDGRQDQNLALEAPSVNSSLSVSARERWEAVLTGLKGMEIPVKVTSALVRGLDYYEHSVFELAHSNGALGPQQGTVLAGGRYDGLIGRVASGLGLKAPRVAAAGWAMGVDRIALLKSEQIVEMKKVIPPVAVLSLLTEQSTIWKGVHTTDLLARGGVKAELLSGTSLRKLLAQANRRQADIVVLLGSDELANGFLTVRRMHDGNQTSCRPSELHSLIERFRKES